MIPCSWTIHVGDALKVLRTMPDKSIDCCVTSPPYWGLRNYGVDGQIGLEPTPEEWVVKMVEVFAEVRRIIKGTLWLNLGDTYTKSGGAGWQGKNGQRATRKFTCDGRLKPPILSSGLKRKDLVGLPWRAAFALQADGWWLRQEIIWHKSNPTPESVKDRPTTCHEKIFLLAAAQHYFYDYKAVQEKASPNTHARAGRAHGQYAPPGQLPHKGVLGPREKRIAGVNPKAERKPSGWDSRPGSHRELTGRYRHKQNESFCAAVKDIVTERNKRSVWKIAIQGFKGAHFATFPEKLVEPCILAGCPVGGTVLDPFAGAGTTGLVALRHGRSFVGIELKPAYAAMATERIKREEWIHAGWRKREASA